MNPLAMLREMRTIKRLLTAAEATARELGEEQPGAEHLLLAALELPDGSARRAFARAGVEPEGVRTALARAEADALVSVGIAPDEARALAAGEPLDAPATGVYRSQPSAREAFQAATALVRSHRPAALKGAHVVAGVASMERGRVASALAALGVDRETLRAAAIDEIRAES